MKGLIENMQWEIIKDIHQVNAGGCAVFAYYFSKILTDLKIPHKITICDCEDNIDDAFNGDWAASHLLVYIPGIGHIDGYKSYSKLDLEYAYSSFESRYYNLDALKCYAFEETWNPSYDRKQNKKLLKIILKHFNENTIAGVNLPQSQDKTICTSRKEVSV